MKPADYGLIYLATVYSKQKAGIEEAFIEASIITANLLCEGYKVYSPIAHTHPIAKYGLLDPYDHSIWMPFDEAIMAKADTLFVTLMDGWNESKGILHEMTFFANAGKPIRFFDPRSMKVSA